MCTDTTCSKTGSGECVPVQLKRVPVQLIQKWAVVKLYRYITNVYRYNRSGFGQKGFLIQKLGASSHSKCFFDTPQLSPSRLLPLTSIPKISCSARVSSVQFRIVCLQSVYESGKPLQIFTSIVGFLLVTHGVVLLDLVGSILCLVVGSFCCQYG